jgi:hypothetical protein
MIENPQTTFHRFVREPMLHFAIIGAGIFATFFALNDTPQVAPENQLVITDIQAARLAEQFRKTWLRQPTATELSGLIDNLVREEVLVREAVGLGLDQNDAVIRQRLRQKMDFLTEVSAQSVAPNDKTLQTFLEANAQDYAVDPHLSFVQIFLGPDITPEQVAAARLALDNGTPAETLGQSTMLPRTVPLTPKWGIDRSFGAAFFASIDPGVVGDWQGPVVSAFGAHLIRVDTYEPGRIPDLDEVREKVERDWRGQQAQKLKDESYQFFRNRYDIQTPDPAAILNK